MYTMNNYYDRVYKDYGTFSHDGHGHVHVNKPKIVYYTDGAQLHKLHKRYGRNVTYQYVPSQSQGPYSSFKEPIRTKLRLLL